MPGPPIYLGRLDSREENAGMFDELQRLHDSADLRRLLTRYAESGAENLETWQDRVMSLEGVDRKELVGLHGELLAYDWIEQNTGVLEVLILGAVPRCYRVTRAGLRALKAAASDQVTEDGEVQAAA